MSNSNQILIRRPMEGGKCGMSMNRLHNKMRGLIREGAKVLCGLSLWTGMTGGLLAQTATSAQMLTNNMEGTPEPDFKFIPQSIWQNKIGDGFRSTVQSFGVSAGANYGFAAFGGRQDHDLSLLSLSYGHMLGPVRGTGHWYKGNAEFRVELFSGAEFSPGENWLVGLTPHVRYDFATGTHWVPFIDGGAGVTATGLGAPDLSGTFEFNLQATVGTQWFLEDDLAIVVETRYLHMSCGGLNSPNLGLNGVTGMIGLSYFF